MSHYPTFFILMISRCVIQELRDRSAFASAATCRLSADANISAVIPYWLAANREPTCHAGSCICLLWTFYACVGKLGLWHRSTFLGDRKAYGRLVDSGSCVWMKGVIARLREFNVVCKGCHSELFRRWNEYALDDAGKNCPEIIEIVLSRYVKEALR